VIAIADEIHGEYFVLPTFVTRAHGIVDDAPDRKCTAEIHLGDFMLGVAIRENEIVEYSWEMSLNPEFGLFSSTVLSSGHDVHSVHLRTKLLHGTL